MGNFSTDPQARLTDSVGKQYVAVRMQQAVPVLDSDWNLLDDLRRTEHEVVGQWFIGDGVPTGNDGFHISANPIGSDVNDFSIQAGLCIVSGKLVRNDITVRYTTQPLFGDPSLVPPLPALTTPGAAKDFIVYLDVFEREIDSQRDPTLVDARIGIETAIRLQREWAVRVARVPEDLPGLSTPPAGHVFMKLAVLHRTTANNITAAMIEDLRDTQLSILRRIEVFDNTGTLLVDNARFQRMLENTNDNLLAFVKYITTQFNPSFTPLMATEVLGLDTALHVAHSAQAGLANRNALTLANRSALAYLQQLYNAEENFMTVWRDVILQIGGSVKKYASYTNFVTGLDQRLNQASVVTTKGTLTGLLPALNQGDLAAAVAMQEEIARLIGVAAANIPRVTIQVSYAGAPIGNLVIGQLARFQFRIKSFATQADTYTVNILPAAGWPRVLIDPLTGNPVPGNQVPVPASGGETTLFVDVTVQAGSTGLQVEASSNANPAEIDQSSSLITLTAGQPAPPPDDKVQFGLENPTQATIQNGVVTVQKPPAVQPDSIAVRIFNNLGQTATFSLAVEVVAGTAVGTWTVALAGPASVILDNGKDAAPGGIKITLASDSVSCQIRYKATTTIAGVTVAAETIIPFIAN
ncbi:MAG TPA: DUF6519 domain-containing protein [Alphaproteobacteria bacterium]|nr:DUF6519 domain-containing protein [Alphaproteobacteria bacterium]